MDNLNVKRIQVPFPKVATFVARLVLKARNGFTKEEGEEILAEFLLLLADVLEANAQVKR
jgi:hypothetical protein